MSERFRCLKKLCRAVKDALPGEVWFGRSKELRILRIAWRPMPDVCFTMSVSDFELFRRRGQIDQIILIQLQDMRWRYQYFVKRNNLSMRGYSL